MIGRITVMNTYQAWFGIERRTAENGKVRLEGPLIRTFGICRRSVRNRGDVCKRGLMAVYVYDVLLAASDPVAACALGSIAEVWECAEAERATMDKSMSSCGFEVQQNSSERGGGFRFHQHSYEEELVGKGGVAQVASQLDFKLPSPEEEADFVKSEDVELVRGAQATRTRPELSVGVAAMSSLCMKAPEIAINIGLKDDELLEATFTWFDLCRSSHAAHGQLNKPRCVRTVEAFSDISYASALGHWFVVPLAGDPADWRYGIEGLLSTRQRCRLQSRSRQPICQQY